MTASKEPVLVSPPCGKQLFPQLAKRTGYSSFSRFHRQEQVFFHSLILHWHSLLLTPLGNQFYPVTGCRHTQWFIACWSGQKNRFGEAGPVLVAADSAHFPVVWRKTVYYQPWKPSKCNNALSFRRTSDPRYTLLLLHNGGFCNGCITERIYRCSAYKLSLHR